MVQGILLALLHRERTGEGQKVNVSLYNSMLAMQMQEAAMIMMADSEVNWAAMPLSACFDTQDGALVLVGAFKANPLQRYLRGAADRRSLRRSALLQSRTSNSLHKAELQRIFRECFASNTRDFWLARLEEQDLLCAPVRDLREALVDPQTLHNQLIMEGEGEGQPVRFIGSPIELSTSRRSACGARRPGSGSIPRNPSTTARRRRHGGRMSVRLVIDQHVATRDARAPEALNAVDLATEAELQRIWTDSSITATCASWS